MHRPLGARPGSGGVEFRVWAPNAGAVAVRVGDTDHPLEEAGWGVYEGTVEGASAGDDYWFVLDGTPWPDPSTRWQPDGMRGPSRVLDTSAFAWTDEGFTPPAMADMVIYELHVGAFSPEGTFDGAIPHLAALAELGVNAIELLPVADGPGDRGWGYDGVYPSATHRAYGGPDGLARLVDAAHGAGIAVILDVVYNHVGASGNQAYQAYGPYFTERYSTFWGEAINYDDQGADGVREWVWQSATQWITDFHIDGLRLDAIHAIYDTSARHVLQELTDRVHAARPGAVVIAESGLNDPKVMQPVAGNGFGCDSAWADDFHHAMRVLLTGEREGYYADFGSMDQLAKAWRTPHVHDGTWSDVRCRIFGAPSEHLAPDAFVVFAQDHDQVGNRAIGDRLPAECRELAAFCYLLSPFVPMLFMGEEYGEDAPFQFFTDHIDEEIAIATREGRRREFAGFAGFAAEDVPDPQDPQTFEHSKLTREETPGMREHYRRLITLRSELGPVESIEHGEDWLVVRRAPGVTLAMNFARSEQEVAGRVLAPLSGEVLR
ncbi:MAG: malto-oligosyltrehalose trehalohydrolase [Solirubrobacteraceae bacterium]